MKFVIAIVITLLFIVVACSVLSLQPANFAWPLESVLPIDEDGNVTEDRYSIEFNTIGLFVEEFQDSLSYKGKELRIIRDNQGYYFITASNFKNVYVFNTQDGALVLNNEILISETGIQNPAFNQRSPNIELIDGDKTYKLTYEGIEKGKE